MKKIYTMMAALLILLCGCQKTQFSTTTRHIKNGKVTYANHYQAGRIKLSKVRTPKNESVQSVPENRFHAPDKTGNRDLSETEVVKIKPVVISAEENLIASTSNEPVILALNDNRFVEHYDPIEPATNLSGAKTVNRQPDTLKPNKQNVIDSISQKVIIFKNGHEKTVRIISRTQNTLTYRSIGKPDTLCKVFNMDVENIYPYYGISKQLPKPSKLDRTAHKIIKFKDGQEAVVWMIAQSKDTVMYGFFRKPDVAYLVCMKDVEKITPVPIVEPNGLVGTILPVVGMLPLVGIPISLISIILGAVSLNKINKNPERYKRKGVAVNAIVWGALGIILNILFIIGMSQTP